MSMNRGNVTMQGVVVHKDTAPKALFSLPQGATPLLAVVQTEVAFNDSGTDTLSLGIPGDADYYAAAIDVGTPGGQLVALSHSPELGSMGAVLATYTGQNGDATGGRAVINLVVAMPFEPR